MTSPHSAKRKAGPMHQFCLLPSGRVSLSKSGAPCNTFLFSSRGVQREPKGALCLGLDFSRMPPEGSIYRHGLGSDAQSRANLLATVVGGLGPVPGSTNHPPLSPQVGHTHLQSSPPTPSSETSIYLHFRGLQGWNPKHPEKPGMHRVTREGEGRVMGNNRWT